MQFRFTKSNLFFISLNNLENKEKVICKFGNMYHHKKDSRSIPYPVVIPDFGVSIFESHHSNDFSMKRSAHTFHQTGLIMAGSGILKVDRYPLKEYQLRDDHFFYIPPGVPHAFVDDKKHPLVLHMICFESDVFNNSYGLSLLKNFHLKWNKAPLIKLGKSYTYNNIVQYLKEMTFEQTQKEIGYELNLKSLLCRLITFICRLKRQDSTEYYNKEQAFYDSLSFLSDNFYQSPSVHELASLANMSYRSYTEYFREKMGKTVVQYMTELKIQYAKKRLAESQNIEFSAYDSGFNDLTNFYRVFKKYTGLTPKQYLIQIHENN